MDLHRTGERWQAELLVGGARVPILGLAGSGIASSVMVEGRTATVVGIVRRPYPSASDQRFAVVPRAASDLTIGGAADDASGTGHGRLDRRRRARDEHLPPTDGGSGAGSPGPGGAADWVAIDLVAIDEHVGERVRVGGLVDALETDGFRLDDGTAVGRVVLEAAALPQLASLGAGDALSVVGRVERRSGEAGSETVIVVDDPAAIARPAIPCRTPAPGSTRSASSCPATRPLRTSGSGRRPWRILSCPRSGRSGSC